MSGNQPSTPTLLSGLKNNISAKLTAPSATPCQIVQHGGQIAPQPQIQVVQPVINTPDMMSLFGLTLQKKYFYLLGLVVLLVVGYLLYSRWNKNKKSNKEVDDDEHPNPHMHYPNHMKGRFPMMPPQYGGHPSAFMGGYNPMTRKPQRQEPEEVEQDNEEEQEEEQEQDEDKENSDK